MTNPVPANPDPLDVTRAMDSLAELSATPKFLDLLKEIGNTPEADRAAVATRLATVDELERRGIDVPRETRLTLRYFEQRPDESIVPVATDVAEPVAADERLKPSNDPGELEPETLASDWTACATTGYFQNGVLICSSIGKKL